ncbi:MAG: PEP/pyruvate-binding domain-containing protein [Actinomycetota bacterium]
MTTSPSDAPLVVLPGDQVDPAVLGGKAGSLWRLVALGFPVPRLAVVTADAYRRAVSGPLKQWLVHLPPTDTDEEGQRAQVDAAFAALVLPDDLTEGVVRAAETIAGSGGALAVRSSASAEDLRGASFAGQYRSFLDVVGPAAVLQALRLTWASLWHPAARRYRLEQGLGDEEAAMAVILMELVRPLRAGVAFTVDPAGDESDVRVEAVAGFADKLVGGEVTPEAFVVPRADPDRGGSPLVAAVARLALDAETAFGCPQDVEWAWDGTAVYVVQSRPITVAGPPDDDGFDRWSPAADYTTTGIAEALPGLLAPLVWDTAGRAIDEAFLCLLADLSALPSSGGDLHALARVRAQAALDLGLLRRAAAVIPGASAGAVERSLFGGDGEPETGAEAGTGSDARRARLLRRLAHDWRVARLRHQARGAGEVFRLATIEIVGHGRHLGSLSDSALLGYRARLADILARGTRAEVAVAACAVAAYDRLEAFLAPYVGSEEASGLAARLTQGTDAPVVLRRWMELAAEAQRTLTGRRAMAAHRWSEAWTILAADGESAKRFRSRFEETIRAAGSRSVMGGPSWVEEPDLAWRAVRAATARHPGAPDGALDARAAEDLLSATPRWQRLNVLTGVLVDTQGLLLRRHVDDARDLLREREALKSALLSMGGEIRRVHLEIGRRLAERGGIAEAAEIDYLGTAELSAAMSGHGPSRAELLRRHRRFGHAAALPLPARFVGRPPVAPAPAPAGDHFQGWAASAGSYEGPARVVTSADGQLEPGEILVAHTTDPSWGPLFLTAGALVVEQGGPLSHAAVVARELGLPAVVNVTGIVERISGGHPTVSVDGSSGEVVVIDDAPSGGQQDGVDQGTGPAAGPSVAGPSVAGPSVAGPAPAGPPPVEGAPADGHSRGALAARARTEAEQEALHVFVPAVMGAGLLYSLLVLAREWTGRVLGRHRRQALVRAQARLVADEVLGGEEAAIAPDGSRATRTLLAVVGAVFLGFAVYVLPGATFNYLRPGGYISEIAWILAVALLLVVVVGTAGFVFGLSALGRRPLAPAARRVVQVSAVVRNGADHHPAHHAWGARWHGTASVLLLAVAAASVVLTLAVAMGNPVVHRADVTLADRVRDTGPVHLLTRADDLGRTGVAVVTSLITVVVLGRRAPRLAAAYPAAVLAGIVVNVLLKGVVDRPRPISPVVGTALSSYPSGHTIQAVLLAVFVTLAVHEVSRHRWLTAVTGLTLGAGAAGTSWARVSFAAHWPSDVIGGALIATLVALIAMLIIHPRPAHHSGYRPLLLLPEVVAGRARVLARGLAVVAVVAVAALSVSVGLPRAPEGALSDGGIDDLVQIILLLLSAVAAAVAWRWEAVGAVMLAATGTAMALFASLQYQPAAALLVALAFVTPALLFWVAWQHGQPLRSLVAAAAAAAVLTGGTWAGASAIYDHYFGPAHPQSPLVAIRSDTLSWVWAGGLSADGVTVTAKLSRPGPAEVWISASPDGEAARLVPTRGSDPSDPRVVTAVVGGLAPATSYYYGVAVNGVLDRSFLGRVRTPGEGPFSFTVAFGACARTGSNGLVFDAIAGVDPLLYLITGDFHYGNVAEPDGERLRAVLDRTLSAPAQQALYLKAPIAYVWDDHDYGGNDADASSPARPMAQAAYRSYVPHGVLASGDGIQQSFVIGRARFILTDTRSYRRPALDGSGTILGEDQLAWFEEELLAARDAGQLAIWVSPTPWIAEANPAADSWAGFDQERRRVADFIDRNGIRLLMLSGDAHMVAIDDGTNSGYASSGASGFPVAHGGALDRPGSLKGGPYSHGAFPGAGQFGVLEIDDDGGDRVRVRITGRNWKDEILVSFEAWL